MRKAGVYLDAKGDGGRWELAQALRWAVKGEFCAEVTEGGLRWTRDKDFGGFGMMGGYGSWIVLDRLLNEYAPKHWPKLGDARACEYEHMRSASLTSYRREVSVDDGAACGVQDR